MNRTVCDWTETTSDEQRYQRINKFSALSIELQLTTHTMSHVGKRLVNERQKMCFFLVSLQIQSQYWWTDGMDRYHLFSQFTQRNVFVARHLSTKDVENLLVFLLFARNVDISYLCACVIRWIPHTYPLASAVLCNTDLLAMRSVGPAICGDKAVASIFELDFVRHK